MFYYLYRSSILRSCFFFFNHTPPPEIYTLSLHDALPIFRDLPAATLTLIFVNVAMTGLMAAMPADAQAAFVRSYALDRKSTRLNSSHRCISYAVFCLKKKKTKKEKHNPKRQNKNTTITAI